MINIHDTYGNLVMHIDPMKGICIGSAFQPEHMGGEEKDRYNNGNISEMYRPLFVLGLNTVGLN